MPLGLFLFKLSPDNFSYCCEISEQLMKMTGRHKAQEGSLRCNVPMGAFLLSPSTSSAERRWHKVLKKTKSEGTENFLGVLMGSTVGY